MMNKKIAFICHKTRGQEIIKILEEMGGVNMYNIDGSEGIIAIETKLRGNPITNDWDYCGLLELGYEVYTLETWEETKKSEATVELSMVKVLTYEEKIETILSILATPIWKRRLKDDILNKLITEAYFEMKERNTKMEK